MLVRRSVLLALAGVLAAAGCRDVDQRDPVPVLVLATFDPGEPGERAATIPIPNDLALQGAPGLPLGETRDALFDLIGFGGWPPPTSMWAPVQGVVIPLRTEVFQPDGSYAPAAAPAELDLSTVDASTVAIVRLNEPPTVVPPATPAVYAGGALILNPVGGTFAPGRYVVAVRGGASGVKAIVDGEAVPLQADRPIALVAPNRDLSQPENRPPRPAGVSEEDFDAQLARLETLRGTFAVGMDWGRVDIGAVCQAALGVTPPEGECWLPPIPAPPLDQPLPTPGMTAAFAGVDLVFPHEELASIQTFEVFTPPALQEEVTP